jgi:glutathione S-transferase
MNKLKLVIGNKNYSSWSLRPWFFLKNLNIDFEEELVWLFEEDTEARLKPYFSNEKVPILVDSSITLQDGSSLQVWDTLAIIEHIAARFNKGWPKDAAHKAIARAVSAEMHSGFTGIRNALPMNCKKHFPDYPIEADVQQDIDRIVAVWDYCRACSNTNGNWLLGEFSGADAMFAPVVMRMIGYDVKLSDFASDYTQMVLENNAMQEWIRAGKQESHVIEEDEV